ncbi:hypothetical protein [Haloferula sp. BvORR071]|uniref:hypothetical protein n=1 Tax=Haloferula sp. BvORR071 TaxID=1396141 RepID=UPI002240F5B3|nr:hypothetical protein [Haloferula sp. BvORR071]
MRTAIDIPEPLYRRAKAKAAEQGTTLREVILAALESDLGCWAALGRSKGEPHSDIDELGIPRLRRAKDDRTVVTEEFLNNLREQEGI